MTGRRIGILGGTFDPIHCGHIETASAAEAALRLTRIYVMPSNLPWHRRPPKTSPFHRFAMVSLAVAGRKGWRAADLELRGDGESYTYRTLQKLHGRGYAPEELFFIIGADAFVEIQTWRQFPAVLDYAHFAVVSRPGLPVTELQRRLPDLAERMIWPSADPTIHSGPRVVLIDATTPSISATDVRDRCRRKESIAGLVPEPVRQHIEQHGLYSSPTPGRRASDAERPAAAGRVHGQD
jgi:nicotinate-nucleotide adenylyltransferase